MKFLRKLLFPLSWLYGCVTALRNFFYDKGWLSSTSYTTPIICVGNLSVGGTGKSPMIEFLIESLSENYKVSVLSRGYKRKTKGYLEVKVESKVSEVGDEPLQFKQKHPDILVSVCADRRHGIEQLKKESDIILLDDAYQHRKVKPYINILLSSYDDLYIHDYMLPSGNLREYISGADRAHFIFITKCPDRVAYANLQRVQYDLKLKPHQKIYFSRIGYDSKIYGKSEELDLDYLSNKTFTLVTGIANPKPMIEFLNSRNFKFEHRSYPDHHAFSKNEIEQLKKEEIILTTEKDYMRLQEKLDKFAMYYLPIKTLILNDQEEFFKNSILEMINNFKNS
jgi:tetraacyldisaccharide 4'-kinase